MAGWFGYWRLGKADAPRSPLPDLDTAKSHEELLYSGMQRYWSESIGFAKLCCGWITLTESDAEVLLFQLKPAMIPASLLPHLHLLSLLVLFRTESAKASGVKPRTRTYTAAPSTEEYPESPAMFPASEKSTGLTGNGSGFLVLCWLRPGSAIFCGPYKMTTVPLLITSFALLIFASVVSWQLLGQQWLGTSGLTESSPGSFWRSTLGSRVSGLAAGDASHKGQQRTTRIGKGRHRTRIPLFPGCNIYEGRWVKDQSYPLYSGEQCGWLAKNWACRFGEGRPSFAYEKMRWQPLQCDLARFNPLDFLTRMMNKTILFMGDSLGQQQFQSLLCLLHPQGPPPSPPRPRRRGRKRGRTLASGNDTQDLSMAAEVPAPAPAPAPTGSPGVVDVGASRFGFHWIPGTRRPTGWAYLFPATNTTVVFRWSTCLCRVEPLEAVAEPGKNSTSEGNSTDAAGKPPQLFKMHLDQVDDWLESHFQELDLVVLNTGHHWNRVKLKDFKFHRNNTRLPELGQTANVKKVVTMQKAHQLTVASVAQWLDQEIHKMRATRMEQDLPQVFFRSRSPRHFLGGEWNTGGHCDHIQAPLKERHMTELAVRDEPMEKAVARVKFEKDSVKLLNISYLSAFRAEAHPAKWDFRGAAIKSQDCLHWCLPGIPDVWNELLLANVVLYQQKHSQPKVTVLNV